MTRPAIFIRWNMNANSWAGGRTMISIHATLEGAINAVPANLRKSFRGEPWGCYVEDFTYEAIERRELED